MNNFTQKRVLTLAPQIQTAFLASDASLSSAGITIEIVQATRTFNEQAAIYAQGRMPTDQVNALRKTAGMASITEAENHYLVNQDRAKQGLRPIVETWAKPGESWHNFGLAFDAVPFVRGLPNWDIQSPDFLTMLTVCRKEQLVCGFDWAGDKKDSDHFQFTGKFGVSPDNSVRQLYDGGGVDAVWKQAFAA